MQSEKTTTTTDDDDEKDKDHDDHTQEVAAFLKNHPLRANECFDPISFQLLPIVPTTTTTTTSATTTTLYDALKCHWYKLFSQQQPQSQAQSQSQAQAQAQAQEKSQPINDGFIEQWFDRIYHQHNESGRYYHTAVHLYEMCTYLECIILQPTNTKDSSQSQSQSIDGKDTTPMEEVCLRLAIFFHDVIYNPQSTTNEKDSLKLFQEFYQATQTNGVGYWKDDHVPTIVEGLILATETHQLIEPPLLVLEVLPRERFLWLQGLFLDLDMAVLGKHYKAYLAYASQIRNEYSFVDHDLYCSKRANILTTFLQRPQLYFHSWFQMAMESQARHNVQLEITMLQNQQIPGTNNEQTI